MKPDVNLIKIKKNKERIKQLLEELVLGPRVKALDWSKITKQTPNMKIGYPGQHLASLITGMEGARTGARGDDLVDGTEVKSCSRVDQLDNCSECKNKVLRTESKCPHCGSSKINRMNDSKWLFSIKSEDELKLLTSTIDRVLLTIADYPEYDSSNFEKLRFQAFEIWVKEKRHMNFKIIMSNYYYKIFLEHIKINPNKTPAPKNFWPYSYQFYLCNPVKVFEAVVDNANTDPEIVINLYTEPGADRSSLEPEKMPIELLSYDEILLMAESKNASYVKEDISDGYNISDFKKYIDSGQKDINQIREFIPNLGENSKSILPLRDTDKISVEKKKYKRR